MYFYFSVALPGFLIGEVRQDVHVAILVLLVPRIGSLVRIGALVVVIESCIVIVAAIAAAWQPTSDVQSQIYINVRL